ncbi:MAG: phosphodiester glycosidase family protein [Saprospiraceae bacterium]|nr:phosphodiester glycosidase family protein [Saprospiraceae bacterium]
MRERSKRKTSVFNQKTMFLGYAHSSCSNFKNKFIVSEIPAEITPPSIDTTPLETEKLSYLKWGILGVLMMSTGWMIGDMLFSKPSIAPIVPQKGAYTMTYQDLSFDIYTVPMSQNSLKLFCTDAQKVPFRDVKTLRGYVENAHQKLVFAMNAGMYTLENLPKGLYIEQKQTLVPLDTADKGFGNFYLQPNGVFAFDDTSAVILATNTFKQQSKNYNYATQSGPLLVTNGVANPVFTPDSKSLYIRNGVGITRSGKIIFAISNQPVNFYVFADLFKTQLHCPNALFLDGAISKMYAPDINRFDTDGNLGPFVVLLK